MFRNAIIAACCLLSATLSCAAQSKADAEKLAAALRGDNQTSAESNKQCKLFTMSEASSYVGEKVQKPENAAMGTGCQWSAGQNGGWMMVQVVPARYHEKPSRAEGYKKLPDIGPQAFVVPEMGGWHAGSLNGARAVHVVLNGKGANEASAVGLLKEAMKRQTAAEGK